MSSPSPRPPDPVAIRFELLDMLGGFLLTQALRTAATLNIADIVGEKPVPVEALADNVGADPSALHRVLRLLASKGVFSEAAPGAWVSTPLSDGLRTDAPASVRHMAMFQGTDTYLAAGEMLRSVRTGESAAKTVFGVPFFEHLASDVESGAVFNGAMAGSAAARAAVALQRDWSEASVVADIGGGNGSLLKTVLEASPHLRGVVFDVPQVIAEARPILRAAGLENRCEAVAGDFFSDALPKADVYVLSQILHDWNDAEAVEILRNCRASIGERGTLLVLEQVLPDGDEPSYAKFLDIIMLLLLSGKERSEAAWRALLRQGGFEVEDVAVHPAIGLIEARPI